MSLLIVYSFCLFIAWLLVMATMLLIVSDDETISSDYDNF